MNFYPLVMEELRTNRQIENAAIDLVLRLEAAAGRRAVDSRGRGAVADIEGDRIIEVKAYGGSARGSDLWLEVRQVHAADAHRRRFHLVIVENVRQGDPAAFRVLDISGERPPPGTLVGEHFAQSRRAHISTDYGTTW